MSPELDAEERIRRLVSAAFRVSDGASFKLLMSGKSPSFTSLAVEDLAWGDFCIGIACVNFAMFVLAARVPQQPQWMIQTARELKSCRGQIAVEAFLRIGPFVSQSLKAINPAKLSPEERPLAIGDVHAMWVLHEVLKRAPTYDESAVARPLGQFIMLAGRDL